MTISRSPSSRGTSELLFVSPRFLFPVDSGGKIRTTQILRGLKGGCFRVRLLSPATSELVAWYGAQLESVCDDFKWWPDESQKRTRPVTRALSAFSRLPIPVRSDWSRAAADCVRRGIDSRPAVTVFDFLHSVVLAPDAIQTPSVLFTHNVETEIFVRHANHARNALLRSIWRSQARKMRVFESAALQRFDVVVAVAERDAAAFHVAFADVQTAVIPTGVDPEFFEFHEPVSDDHVVFCGSMDWLANQEAIDFFLMEVWDRINARVPHARFTVIGRSPPAWLVEKAVRRRVNWTFTGYVDDVRPFMKGAAVSVIPMRVGGGTRLKAYEAMAAGTPIVSTTIGVEGLPVEHENHYIRADDPLGFADAVCSLLLDRDRRSGMARRARHLVESRFSYLNAARVFEDACRLAMNSRLRQ